MTLLTDRLPSYSITYSFHSGRCRPAGRSRLFGCYSEVLRHKGSRTKMDLPDATFALPRLGFQFSFYPTGLRDFCHIGMAYSNKLFSPFQKLHNGKRVAATVIRPATVRSLLAAVRRPRSRIAVFYRHRRDGIDPCGRPRYKRCENGGFGRTA